MGIKEDALPTRVLVGYSAQIRPEQINWGKCCVCKRDVWVAEPEPGSKWNTIVQHYGCMTTRKTTRKSR